MVLAAPMKWVPNITRSPSVSTRVRSAPTVGPSALYMPPAIAANTICREMPTPATVSGLRYMMYCAKIEPPAAVMAALTTKTRSFSLSTSTPAASAAVSSSPIASSAARRMPRLAQARTPSTASQSTSATK